MLHVVAKPNDGSDRSAVFMIVYQIVTIWGLCFNWKEKFPQASNIYYLYVVVFFWGATNISDISLSQNEQPWDLVKTDCIEIPTSRRMNDPSISFVPV